MKLKRKFIAASCAILRTKNDKNFLRSMGGFLCQLEKRLALKSERKCSILEDLLEVGTVWLEPRNVLGDFCSGDIVGSHVGVSQVEAPPCYVRNIIRKIYTGS